MASGLWNAGCSPQYSKETQNLMREMMRESKLTNLQVRKMDRAMSSGDGSLPLGAKKAPKAKARPRKAQKYLNPINYTERGVRTREQIEASGAYEKPDYAPRRGRLITDKEKERLGNIMAYGKNDEPGRTPHQRQLSPGDFEATREPDRFQELMQDIEERQRFLEEMEELGEGKKYRPIIATEISQKVREMELIDRKKDRELEEAISAAEKKS